MVAVASQTIFGNSPTPAPPPTVADAADNWQAGFNYTGTDGDKPFTATAIAGAVDINTTALIPGRPYLLKYNPPQTAGAVLDVAEFAKMELFGSAAQDTNTGIHFSFPNAAVRTAETGYTVTAEDIASGRLFADNDTGLLYVATGTPGAVVWARRGGAAVDEIDEWQANEDVTATTERVAARNSDGELRLWRSNAVRTTGAAFDAAEELNWTDLGAAPIAANRFHVTLAAITALAGPAAVDVNNPTVAEIQRVVTAAAYTAGHGYWTGDDNPATPSVSSYFVDAAGVVTAAGSAPQTLAKNVAQYPTGDATLAYFQDDASGADGSYYPLIDAGANVTLPAVENGRRIIMGADWAARAAALPVPTYTTQGATTLLLPATGFPAEAQELVQFIGDTANDRWIVSSGGDVTLNYVIPTVDNDAQIPGVTIAGSLVAGSGGGDLDDALYRVRADLTRVKVG